MLRNLVLSQICTAARAIKEMMRCFGRGFGFDSNACSFPGLRVNTFFIVVVAVVCVADMEGNCMRGEDQIDYV
jgi:hypothetical protein